MSKWKKLLSAALVTGMVCSMPGFSAFAAEVAQAAAGDFVVLSDADDGQSRYLTTPNSNAFNVFMYNNTFSGTFGDQHMAGIELSMHGYRIATNGDIHLLPTPEQWDATPAPSVDKEGSGWWGTTKKEFDEATNTVTVPMTYKPNDESQLTYKLVASPTSDGVRLQVILTSDLPEDLAGKARFNLEFIPSKYQSKSYQADTNDDGIYDDFGTFPLHPQDDMEETERADLDQEWYVQEWNEDRGNAQPVAFATGYGFTFAPEDEDYHISIDSELGEMELFDGRNRAQNGWYVLSSLIESGKSGDVVVDWVIRPDVHEDWVRDPVIGFSQAGYSPAQDKFAVIELDKYDTDYPTTASLWQVNADGTRTQVHEGTLSETTDWQRYKYARYDFSDYTKAGLYELHYDGQVSEVFPIGKDVYDNSWQTALSVFMAVQMDHMEVREGYRIWHGAPHMDDGTIGPQVSSYFDGMGMPRTLPEAITDRGYTWESYVEGLNVGGWFDAGDFDIQTARNVEVLEDLIYAAEAFDNMGGYDTLSVTWDDETGGVTEMHRPDGIPDVLQQIAHGTKQILAQYEELGGVGGTHEVRTLRQYTHLGDPSSDTDGYLYDPSLAEDEIVERDGKVYSGKPDDRYFLLSGGGGSFSTNLLGSNSANFAGAAYLLADVYPEIAKRCMDAAMTIWAEQHNEESPNMGSEWNTLVQLMLATHKMEADGTGYLYQDQYDFEYFKARLSAMADQAVTADNFNASGWGATPTISAVFVMDLMDEDYRAKVAEAAAGYAEIVDEKYRDLPYGVMWTEGSGWGGSPTIIALGQKTGILYSYFPENALLKEYTLNAVDYILGRHPQTNASWVSGVGTKSTLQPYNSNRGDESFIPGSILPGHITFAPDYVESLDDFSFLWFEGESIVNYQSQWISAAMAASMIANEESEPEQAPTKDFQNDITPSLTMVDDDGYLEAGGFNVFMYSTTFDRTFGDQHCAGIELVQDGRRIATNGDIHLLPTPEQWDATPAPIRNDRTFDQATGKVTVDMTLPEETLESGGVNPAVDYQLIAEPEAGGIKLTIKLDQPLPEDLIGKAGFNLEFLPAVFIGKSYQTDTDGDGNYDDYGVFPLSAQDEMEEVDRARTDDQLWYVQDWNEDRGDYQPLPFTQGTKMTFASEDDDYRIRVTSDTGTMQLLDGRNRAQNGWFVLRELIPAGETEIVWHISPDADANWTREPSIGHSQAGYEPHLDKVAEIELDPDYSAPETASVLRLNADGSYETVFTGAVSEPTSWQRYEYREFDFSSVTTPGMYVLEYGGVRTDPFPIANGVYDESWQLALSNFLAVQMDHIKVREGYKIWHSASHMDDALQAPLNTPWFDGWSMGAESDSPYEAYEHIPGLNVGGWYDAGDFDIQTSRNMQVIQDLALAWLEYGVDYDTLTVEWDENTANGATGGSVELHRPDGIPDIQQQIKHGILQILAQLESVGFVFPVLEVPSLRQYTHLGDGSKDTDNKVYEGAANAENASVPTGVDADDRLALAGTKSTSLQLSAAAALAAAGNSLKGFDDELAQTCIDTAVAVWNEEAAAHEGTGTTDWSAAVELALATGEQVYKDRVLELLDTVLTNNQMGRNGWKAVRLIPIMDEAYESKVLAAVQAYVPYLDSTMENNPYGVQDTFGMWGGSTNVVDMGVRMSILHKYFPAAVSSEYTYRVMNYILGTHPYNDTSWLTGVGTKSVEVAYGSNRADHYYNAGGIVPGYVTIAPDFPEALDDFGFLWFESEYVIDTSAKWIVLANGASQFAEEEFTVTFNSNGGSEVEAATVASGAAVAEPAAPTKDGATFTGWFLDKACTIAYDFATPVTGSFTLYAGWDGGTVPSELTATVTGGSEAGGNERVPYVFSYTGTDENLGNVTLRFTVAGDPTGVLTDKYVMEALGGFQILVKDAKDNGDGTTTHSVVLAYNLDKTSQQDVKDILSFVLRTAEDQTGKISVTLNDAIFTYTGDSNLHYAVISGGPVITDVVEVRYDINGDGVFNQADITEAQKFYRASEGDDNWDAAKKADINGDGVITVDDLVELSYLWLDVLP